MFFRDIFMEENLDSTETVEKAEDNLLGVGSEEDNINDVANDINAALAVEAFNSASFFPNGEEAVNEYLNYINNNEKINISEAIISAVAKNNNIIQLNARDDMKRRARLGCLILARNAKDPLFKKLSVLRTKERALRKALFKKYMKRAYAAATLSMRKHNADVKSSSEAPKFHKDTTGARTNFAAINQGPIR